MIGRIGLRIGLTELVIGLIELRIGLMELGIDLIELGIGLRINNARCTVLTRVTGPVYIKWWWIASTHCDIEERYYPHTFFQQLVAEFLLTVAGVFIFHIFVITQPVTYLEDDFTDIHSIWIAEYE